MLPHSEPRQPYVKFSSNLTQLADISFVTNQTGVGVAGQHKFYQNLARFQNLGRMGIYDHSFSDWRVAGTNQSP